MLDAAGEYVELTVPRPTNAIVVRYSLPDTREGLSYSWPLKLSLGVVVRFGSGSFRQYIAEPDITLTTTFSHYYGPLSTGGNTPSAGNPHHFYDEVSHLLSRTLQPGDTIVLKFPSPHVAQPYINAHSVTVDFVDFELAPAPNAMPAGYLNVRDYGSGVGDWTPAFQEAVNQGKASGRGVWIPAGTYSLSAPITVDNVFVRGAGMWHTILTGNGFRSRSGSGSTGVLLSDFQIRGNVTTRCGTCASGISGAFSSTLMYNVWIEHMFVGVYTRGPATGAKFQSMRVRNTTADGIHLSLQSSAGVAFSHIRNTGDDGISLGESATKLSTDNQLFLNTVELPILANGIGVYGGTNNSVTNNKVVDAGFREGGGIYIANRYGSGPPRGTTTIANNTVIRSGSIQDDWFTYWTVNRGGAIWFDSYDGAINVSPIIVTNLLIEQSNTSAIQFISGNNIGLNNRTTSYPVNGVSFSDVTVRKPIDGAQGSVHGVQLETNVAASFQNVVVNDLDPRGHFIFSCNYRSSPQHNLVDLGGNSTWLFQRGCEPAGAQQPPSIPPHPH